MRRIAIALVAAGLFVAGAAQAQVINEFVANHTGTDTNEYIEVFGAPNTDYSNLYVVEIEGDAGSTGLIDDATYQVGTTDAGGFWCTPFLANVIENGTVTFLLVQGYSGALNSDIDLNDDGVIDTPYWTAIIDAVAVTDGGVGDLTYAGFALDSTLPPAGFAPGGVSRIPNGVDTDSAADWARNDFDGIGLPGFTGGLDPGEAINTYCTLNTTDVATPATSTSFGRIKALYR